MPMVTMYVFARTRAQERAQKKYPKQPERARQMTDHECGVCNGPYNLEPLAWPQRIKLILGLAEYERDVLEVNFLDMSPPWRRQLRYVFKVLTTGKC